MRGACEARRDLPVAEQQALAEEVTRVDTWVRARGEERVCPITAQASRAFAAQGAFVKGRLSEYATDAREPNGHVDGQCGTQMGGTPAWTYVSNWLLTLSTIRFVTLILGLLSFHSFRFTKSQKRASILLSDVSQSIFAALAPPPPGPTSSTTSSRTNASSRPQHSSRRETKNLLEDDDLGVEEEKQLGDVLVPNVLTPTPPMTTKPHADRDDNATTNDDDDWNW